MCAQSCTNYCATAYRRRLSSAYVQRISFIGVSLGFVFVITATHWLLQLYAQRLVTAILALIDDAMKPSVVEIAAHYGTLRDVLLHH